MLVIDSIEKLKGINKWQSNASVSVVFKGLSVEGEDIQSFFNFVEGLDDLFIVDCVFNQEGSLDSRQYYINSYESIKMVNSVFYNMDLEVTQLISYRSPSIQIINSRINGNLEISGDINIFSSINSHIKSFSLFCQPNNTIFANSSLGKFVIRASEFEVSDRTIICSSTEILKMYLEDVSEISGLSNQNSVTNVYHLLFYNDTEVTIDETTFEDCDLSNTSFDNIIFISGMMFKNCKVHNMDLGEIGADLCNSYGNGCSIDFKKCSGSDSIIPPDVEGTEVEKVNDNYVQIWIGY